MSLWVSQDPCVGLGSLWGLRIPRWVWGPHGSLDVPMGVSGSPCESGVPMGI